MRVCNYLDELNDIAPMNRFLKVNLILFKIFGHNKLKSQVMS